MIDLSVIVLTFNVRELVIRCVQSILADRSNAKFGIEIIVVDNASRDDSVAALQGAYPADKHPGVTIIANQDNIGFSRGNNAGMRVAHGRHLLCLNPDTEVFDGALGALIEFMDQHADAGACGPMLIGADGALQPSGRALPTAWTVFAGMTKLYRLWQRDLYAQRGRDYAKVARVGEVSGAALCVRREVFAATGGFDERFWAYYEDVDWCKRIAESGHAIYYVPTAKVLHLWKRSSRSVPELAMRAGIVSQRHYFHKHHSGIQAVFVDVLLAGKELALLAASVARLDRASLGLHWRMLKCALAPLARVRGHDVQPA